MKSQSAQREEIICSADEFFVDLICRILNGRGVQYEVEDDPINPGAKIIVLTQVVDDLVKDIIYWVRYGYWSHEYKVRTASN